MTNPKEIIILPNKMIRHGMEGGHPMSEEVKAIVRELDSGQVETQLALQCAPLIAGLKISNLLIIEKSNLPYMNYC